MKKLLTIVCHLHFGYKDIRKAMMSILSQSDKNFDVICILDNINQSIKDILVEPEIDALIKKANNISAIVVDKKLGHTWCFNRANEMIKTPYVYYCSGGVVFDKDFVKEINAKLAESKPDMLIFNYSEKAHKHFLELTEKTDSYHFYQTFLKSYTNKIFSFDFFKKHNIKFVEFKHYTMLFLYTVLSYFPYIEQLPKVLVSVEHTKRPGYNTYDILSQFEEIFKKSKDSPFYKQFKDSVEYMFIRTALFTFLRYMYTNFYEDNKKSFKISVDKAVSLVNKYVPKWRENKYLLTNDTMDDKYIWNYLKNFDDSIKKIAAAMEGAKKHNVW